MFCLNCGNRVEENVHFCASCGAAVQNKRKTTMRVLMLLVSILLILVGTGYMALTLAGRTATAHVTGYEQRYIINNDDSTRNPSRYKLDYQFALKGERYTGSVTRIFQGGSHMRQTISVRYLTIWPHLNAEDSGEASPTGPILIGAGILLLGLEVKKKPRSRN